ncbi:MAG: hypothetical protein AMXMBFR48_15300 [Ignavibacteriales bacterium]
MVWFVSCGFLEIGDRFEKCLDARTVFAGFALAVYDFMAIVHRDSQLAGKLGDVN